MADILDLTTNARDTQGNTVRDTQGSYAWMLHLSAILDHLTRNGKTRTTAMCDVLWFLSCGGVVSDNDYLTCKTA